MLKHIHVIGLDSFNLEELRSVPHAEDYAFHPLVPYPMIVNPPSYPMESIMETAWRELEAAPGVDAIIGHWDFPTTSMLPILRRAYGLPTPSLDSVLICENKYWARLAMRDAVPECTPSFQHIDPFDEDPWNQVQLDLPFWLKPNVAFSSYLGFYIESRARFQEAIRQMRQGIARFAEPFEYFMDHVEDREALPAVGSGGTGIMEGIIYGDLCTLEGFVLNGKVVVYGVIDSLRDPKKGSFFSYQIPSQLPPEVQNRMIGAAGQVLTRIGLDDTPFNMEFFWNRETDRIWLLEINPRISKSHCPIFRMTAGASHHEVAIDIALRRHPKFPRHEGQFSMAAKFMPRVYEDAQVTRAPKPEDIERLCRRFPELVVHIHVTEGTRLRNLRNQDSYSFEIADVFLGGNSEEELHAKFSEVMTLLDFRFSHAVPTNYE